MDAKDWPLELRNERCCKGGKTVKKANQGSLALLRAK
jgi:hypothetical protein